MMEWRRTKHHQIRSWEQHQKGKARSTSPQGMKVDREGVGETHTDPIGEMSKFTNLIEPKSTKHDKTRYSSEEGEKIPSDLGECRVACLEERKVDPDGTKMMRADTTGEEWKFSQTAVNVDKVESFSKVKTDKTQRTLFVQAGEVRNCSNASDKDEEVETWDYFKDGKLDRSQRRNTLVGRNETGPIRATRKRTETSRTRRKITH